MNGVSGVSEVSGLNGVWGVSEWLIGVCGVSKVYGIVILK